ncbi:MAG: hypothetical protein NC324_04390 [Bacteroides sp.]|nr:hypothetical protein [Bacteroides sp.]
MKQKVFKHLVILCLAAFSACNRNTPGSASGYGPQEGDLLFVVAASGDFSEAVVEATAQGDSLRFSHVAIVAVEDGTPYVVEASSRHGVTRTGWRDFLDNAQQSGGKPAVVVKRVADKGFPLSEAVARARSHIGEAYDWSFLPDNGRMYCSELVYESYRKTDGSPLFTARPMNFRAADGSMPAFWTELFERLGEPIPEGVPGTNPNDMAKDPALREVARF